MKRDLKAIFQLKKTGLILMLIVLVCVILLGLAIGFFDGTYKDGPQEIINLVAILIVTAYISMNAFFKIFLMFD